MSISANNLSQPLKGRRTRWRWIALGVVFTVLLLLVGSCAGWYYYHRYNGPKELAAVTTKLDDTEPGWRWDDLEKRRAVVRDEENGALQVAAAAGLMPKKWPKSLAAGDEATYLEMGRLVGLGMGAQPIAPAGVPTGSLMQVAEASRPVTPITPRTDSPEITIDNLSPEIQLDEEQTEFLRYQLKQAMPALEQARKVADLPRGRYAAVVLEPIPLATSLGHASENYRVAYLLRNDARLQAQDGDIEAACRTVRATINTGRAIGDEQVMISQLVRLADVALGMATLERVLAQGQPSAETLGSLQALIELEEQELPGLEIIAFRGERAMGDRLFENMAAGTVPLSALGSGTPSSIPLVDRWTEGRWQAMLPHIHAVYLRRMTKCVEVAKLPFREQKQQLATLEKQPRDVADIFTNLLMAALSRMPRVLQYDQARLRCATVALAAERYRLDAGSWPESAEVLVKAGLLREVPADPFDGKPLRCNRTADGVVVYSVGPDEEDNGGKLNRKNIIGKGSDMGFQLWDVGKRRQRAVAAPAGDDKPMEKPQ